MAKLLQTLIPILFLAAAATALSQVPPPSSTSFYYQFYCAGAPLGLTLQGDASIPFDTFTWNTSFLRLTGADTNAVGRVLYSHPVEFWQAGGEADFNTTFTFLITPEPGRSPADGIAFFIAPVGSTPPNGAAGANFGVFDASGNGPGVFAVEFDTFVNAWDPDYRHVGIDIGSRVSSNTTFAGDAIVGKNVTAAIGYAAATKVISVAVSAGTETFELSYEYDLSGLLPQQVQVGLSASTGEEVAAHDIYSWYFKSTMVDTGAADESRGQLIRQFV